MFRLLAGRLLAVAARLLTIERHWHVKGLIANGASRDRVEQWRRSLRG